MTNDVLIVGAGLSGLCTAHLLKKQGVQATVIDARDRPGGRILSKKPTPDYDTGFDMGPSWFWPWQTRMLALINELALSSSVYEQHSQGQAVIEYRTGQLAQQTGTASMAGSLRLTGGLQTLVNSLVESIGTDHVLFNRKIDRVVHVGDSVAARFEHLGTENTVHTQQIVLAAPPRVLASHIEFAPTLDAAEQQLMANTPTWMAGQAKFVAVYATPFWRDKGLSGDGVSELGPLGEIHDASANDGAPYALFGFVGVPAEARANRDQQIIQAASEQLARMFGTGVEKPLHVFYKDWANDELTATDADRKGVRSHAHQTVSTTGLWDSQLHWAGSETASVSGGDNGYLEGALAAAERVVEQVMS